MAAPSYTEDLTDIDLAQSTTNWLQINFAGGGGGALGTGADFAMQGTLCVDRQVTSNERGAMFDNTTGISLGADDHIFQWGFVATPGITDNLATRGAYCIAGTGTGALVQFHVEGNDTYGAQGRVGKCYTYRYVNTANTGSIPYRTLTGSPGATSPRYFGFGIKTTAAAKGANVGVDAIRYGTGAYLTAGELISAGDASDNPCTFAGFQGQNDALSNRWGILTSIGGTNYELQGRFVIGQNNAGTATLARFRDSDVNISLVDTVHSLTDFTQIIIDHASTRVEWTNVNITALGTNNPGKLVVNSANPTVVITNGTLTDTGTSLLRSNTTITGMTWRGTDQITQNGATIDGCLIDSNTNASNVLASNPTVIKNCTFLSDGTGHAIEITTAGTYNIDNNTFTGYGADDTTDASIYNNSAGAVTLDVINGSSGVTVRNGTSATTTVNNSVTVTVDGVAEGTAIKVIANETVGTVTTGDVLHEGIADSTGGTSFSLDYEGAFGAGLDVLIRARNQGLCMAAVKDDGGTQVDDTANSNSPTSDDMVLTPAVPAVNDAYYFGHNEEFPQLKVWVSTAGVNQTITWEYWNGAWTALSGVVDGTSSFTATGDNIVSWTAPSDWADTTVNSQGPFRYVRARVSAIGGSPTGASGRQCQLDVTRYLPIPPSGDLQRTITSSGLTATLAQAVDSISRPFG